MRLSELFEDPSKALVLMHLHVRKETDQAVSHVHNVGRWLRRCRAAPPGARELRYAGGRGWSSRYAQYAAGRGWSHARLVSAAESDFKRQLGFEGNDGSQLPGVSVLVREADGAIRHFYSQSALMGDDKGRGMDLLSPVWNYLDLTPDGRGDWFPGLDARGQLGYSLLLPAGQHHAWRPGQVGPVFGVWIVSGNREARG